MNHSTGYFSKTRVEAFSDGIFAIIVTLLVLEIKVPEIHQENSTSELLKALTHLLPKFISWIISFMILCVVWVNHHRIFEQLKGVTHGTFWLNANLMLWCSFVPFPTALMGDYMDNSISLSIFGVVMAMVAMSFTFMRFHLLRNPASLQDSTDVKHFRVATTRSLFFGPLLYLAGASLGFIHPYLALSIYIFIPIYFIIFNSTKSISHT